MCTEKGQVDKAAPRRLLLVTSLSMNEYEAQHQAEPQQGLMLLFLLVVSLVCITSQREWELKDFTTKQILPNESSSLKSLLNNACSDTPVPPALPYLSNHGAPIIDELGQHHGHVVVNGGGVIGPFSRVAHKSSQCKDCSTANLRDTNTH